MAAVAKNPAATLPKPKPAGDPVSIQMLLLSAIKGHSNVVIGSRRTFFNILKVLLLEAKFYKLLELLKSQGPFYNLEFFFLQS